MLRPQRGQCWRVQQSSCCPHRHDETVACRAAFAGCILLPLPAALLTTLPTSPSAPRSIGPS